MYNKPFQFRSPDYRRVQYEFTYSSEASAAAAFEVLSNKRYAITPEGEYVLPVGHRIRSRDEKLDGPRVTFLGQIKAVEIEAPETQALELEIAGTEGALTGKTVIA